MLKKAMTRTMHVDADDALIFFQADTAALKYHVRLRFPREKEEGCLREVLRDGVQLCRRT